MAQIATGVLAVIGAATVLWVVCLRKRPRQVNPQDEIDRRIRELEDLLQSPARRFRTGSESVTSFAQGQMKTRCR